MNKINNSLLFLATGIFLSREFIDFGLLKSGGKPPLRL